MVKLRTNFEIAHGDLQDIVTALREMPMSYRCVGFSWLLDKHADPNVNLGANDQMARFAEKGLLVGERGNYELGDNVGEVLLAMSGFTSIDEYKSARDGHASCPPWQFDLAVLTAE